MKMSDVSYSCRSMLSLRYYLLLPCFFPVSPSSPELLLRAIRAQINHYQFQRTDTGYRSTKGLTFPGLAEVVASHANKSEHVAVPLATRIAPVDSST